MLQLSTNATMANVLVLFFNVTTIMTVEISVMNLDVVSDQY